ncbi:hypothetical protein [Neoroseomonas soli]|uniref:Uncharacterized protein n=1 Tax=Neoroseomonas soli TaxID=1081025 RepID=A0A9X9WXM3_9PROT|nr:hypothetical protein [Neoroseomonas soli]MBR0671902.1 hypothetical protein [Neoroseomonas soli]
MSEEFEADIFPSGEYAVQIMDLSGANSAEPVETIRGFLTIEHANAFARRYVRDSVERCRAPSMDAKAVLDAWFAYGEDAEVLGAGDDAWVSRSELKDFADTPVSDPEERNWRILDPRLDEDEVEDEP